MEPLSPAESAPGRTGVAKEASPRAEGHPWQSSAEGGGERDAARSADPSVAGSERCARHSRPTTLSDAAGRPIDVGSVVIEAALETVTDVCLRVVIAVEPAGECRTVLLEGPPWMSSAERARIEAFPATRLRRVPARSGWLAAGMS